jgi:hypothetical protein
VYSAAYTEGGVGGWVGEDRAAGSIGVVEAREGASASRRGGWLGEEGGGGQAAGRRAARTRGKLGSEIRASNLLAAGFNGDRAVAGVKVRTRNVCFTPKLNVSLESYLLYQYKGTNTDVTQNHLLY